MTPFILLISLEAKLWIRAVKRSEARSRSSSLTRSMLISLSRYQSRELRTTGIESTLQIFSRLRKRNASRFVVTVHLLTKIVAQSPLIHRKDETPIITSTPRIPSCLPKTHLEKLRVPNGSSLSSLLSIRSLLSSKVSQARIKWPVFFLTTPRLTKIPSTMRCPLKTRMEERLSFALVSQRQRPSNASRNRKRSIESKSWWGLPTLGNLSLMISKSNCSVQTTLICLLIYLSSRKSHWECSKNVI